MSKVSIKIGFPLKKSDSATWMIVPMNLVSVVPRVLFEFPTPKDYSALGDLKERQAVIKNLVNIAKVSENVVIQINNLMLDVKKKDNVALNSNCVINAFSFQLHHFDGLVVEVWTQLAANGLLKFATELIQSLAQKMKSVGLDCIVVIPPSRG